MATGGRGYSSWFPGFGSEGTSCAAPQETRRGSVLVENIDRTRQISSESNDTIVEEAKEERRQQLEDTRRKEDKRISDVIAGIDKSIPEDIQLALRRSHAMCKQMIQAHEADAMKRIGDMEKQIKQHGDFIADLNMSSQPPCSSSWSRTSVQGSICQEPARPDIESSAIDNLKDDVQTIIDAMRVELQKQKEAVTSLTEQVQKPQGKLSSMFKATPQQQSIQLESFNELQMEVKKDIEKLGAKIEEAVADSRQYLTKQAFEEFSKKMAQQFENARKGLADVKNSQELIAVKAGFLAVAASECSHEEKDGLFRSLKEQEDECYRKGIGGNPRITEC